MNDFYRPLPARRAPHATLACALLALALGQHAPNAHAEAADRDKPINVQADNMSYDDLKQVNVITGNVVITKGTIVMRADRVEIRQDPQGYQYATGTSSGSKLSYFRQKRDGVNEYIEGEAVRIDYDGKRDLTTLTTRAVVRRLQGTSTLIDEVHGNVITYDGQKDFYTASASKNGTGPSSGRVRAMLSPRGGASAPPPDGAPATLVPSSQIDGNAKP